MLKPPIYIFTDFDGTITLEDLGDKVFDVFGKLGEYSSRLSTGELTVPEYWHLLSASIQPGVTPEMIQSWAHEQPADNHFRGFVQFCRKHNIPLTVVSDGFDVYIDTVLKREGAEELPRFTNQLVYANGVFTPIFPGRDESCTCFCASCKRNSVLRSVPPEALIVYIGDGHSDFCAAEHADIIFAKKALAAFCNRKRLPHYPFTSFADVQTIMTQLLERRRLRYRHQATLRRKEAFETE